MTRNFNSDIPSSSPFLARNLRLVKYVLFILEHRMSLPVTSSAFPKMQDTFINNYANMTQITYTLGSVEYGLRVGDTSSYRPSDQAVCLYSNSKERRKSYSLKLESHLASVHKVKQDAVGLLHSDCNIARRKKVVANKVK